VTVTSTVFPEQSNKVSIAGHAAEVGVQRFTFHPFTPASQVPDLQKPRSHSSQPVKPYPMHGF